MSHRLKTGDRVTWNTPQGVTTGTVVRRIIRDTELDGQVVSAS
ncbi:hypervirulence associated TUDOR domain-containing protein [Paraburkholderia atlantica]